MDDSADRARAYGRAVADGLNLVGYLATDSGLAAIRGQLGSESAKAHILETVESCHAVLSKGTTQPPNPEAKARLLGGLSAMLAITRTAGTDDDIRTAAKEVITAFMLYNRGGQSVGEPPAEWRPRIDRIDDPIADDLWAYTRGEEEIVSRVVVGRPHPIPNDPKATWYCPVSIQHREPPVRCCYGVGPVDALMNAMQYVHQFFVEVRPRPGVRRTT